MADFDVIVIGGGPAGYSAAMRAADNGASVALVEPERLGGACVHFTCIPTNILLGATSAFVDGRELDVMGVFDVGSTFNFGRARARKDALVKQIAENVAAALRMRRVTHVQGRGAFAGRDRLALLGGDGRSELTAEAFIIATGTRWEPPALPGIAPERVLTVDAIQSMTALPASALVLGGGPSDTAFALEYAFLLAAAGARVTLATQAARLLPALDAVVGGFVAATLTDAGVQMLTEAAVDGGDTASVTVAHPGGRETIPAEVVLAADVRRPGHETLNLPVAGVDAGEAVRVDRACRTSAAHVFAAGDVTGGPMLTNAALHMGEVAAINATGGEAVARLRALPYLLHTVPEIGWVGLTEEAARAAGHDVRVGDVDLGYSARAIVLGGRTGLLRLVADRDTGEILGVHVAGPCAAEVLAAAAMAMQAELTVHDLAATVHWHPSMAESLAEAARRAR